MCAVRVNVPLCVRDATQQHAVLAAHGATSYLSVRAQPPRATGAPSKTSTISFHTSNTYVASCHYAATHAGVPSTHGWQEKSKLPFEIREAEGFAANGRLYVFGGFETFWSKKSKKTISYNPNNNKWDQHSDIPMNIQGTCTRLQSNRACIVTRRSFVQYGHVCARAHGDRRISTYRVKTRQHGHTVTISTAPRTSTHTCVHYGTTCSVPRAYSHYHAAQRSIRCDQHTNRHVQ